jgi:anti-sigma28 factor (negative regulator of flagellin synthesis)
MQISLQEVEKVLRRAGQSSRDERGAGSVEELARRHGVEEADVRQYLEVVRMAEADPGRARRVEEVIARVQAGTYHVDAEAIVDMAERRALADRANEL